MAFDQLGAQLGDGVGFGIALLFGAGLAVFVGHGDVESRHAQAAPIVMEWVESGEARLAIGREHGLEALVDEGEDRGAGAEVGGDRQKAVGVLGAEGVARLHIGADVGAPEAIDRLLRVADQEERARPDLEAGPIVIAIDRLATQPPEDFGLQGIGVLKLVDEDMGETLSQRLAHGVVVAQQVARGENQIVEIELGAGALVVAIALQDRSRFVDQRGQGMAGDGLHQRDPSVATGGVVGLGGVVQPVAIGLGETDLFGRSGPFALPAVGGESAGLGAKIWVGPRGQEPNEARGRRGIGTVRHGGRHFGQPLDDRHCFRLGRRRAIHEVREIRRGLPERREVAAKWRDGRGRERGATADVLGDLMD